MSLSPDDLLSKYLPIEKEVKFLMGLCSRLLLLLCLTWNLFIHGSSQLQSSQAQLLVQLKKQLQYPKQLELWYDHRTNFCSLPSSPQVNLTCQYSSVTEIRIIGDKQVNASEYNGFAVPNQTLTDSFSMDSFVTTLVRLSSLKVLKLVSLGIWGPFPDKIRRLSSLEYLDLSSNFLFGSIPPKIATMVKLETFILDDNFLNDTVPVSLDSVSNLTVLSMKNNRLKGPLPDLSKLTNLKLLDLSGNKLDSGLPTLPKGIVMALLGNNSFSGSIRQKFNRFNQLQQIDFSFNQFSGTLPASLFSLPNIVSLSLASNMFTGSLPNNLACGRNLVFVDVSNNKLTGGLPSCLRNESDTVKFGGNCLVIGVHHQHPASYCLEVVHKEGGKHSGGHHTGILVGLIVGVLIVMVLLATIFLILCRRCCSLGTSEQHLLQTSVQDNSAAGFVSEYLTNARYISEATKFGVQGLPACRLFTLEELMEATNNFDNSVIIGEGSKGKLYKGRLQNGTQVAIRCLPSSRKYTIRNLKLRLDLLAKLRHPHLVCLLGHCIDCGGHDDYHVNKVFLIYEYIPNGKFSASLSETSTGKILDWSERLKILIGVAKAVQFLHTGVIPGFFNNRLKTNNILLNEHRLAKLSDYGLSIVSEDTNNNNNAKKGEGPKSWQMSRLDDDVYSFGIIVLESLVGPLASDRKEIFIQNALASLENLDGRRRIVNQNVLATSLPESLSTIISIMNKCICSESLSRPSFEDILWNLEYAAQVQGAEDTEHRFNNVSM